MLYTVHCACTCSMYMYVYMLCTAATSHPASDCARAVRAAEPHPLLVSRPASAGAAQPGQTAASSAAAASSGRLEIAERVRRTRSHQAQGYDIVTTQVGRVAAEAGGPEASSQRAERLQDGASAVGPAGLSRGGGQESGEYGRESAQKSTPSHFPSLSPLSPPSLPPLPDGQC